MPLSSTFAEVVERVVHARRSVRHFSGELIKQGDLDRIVGAGIAAPSGSNWQNQRFLIVEDPDEIDRIGKCRYVWPYPKADYEKMRESRPSGILGGAAVLVLVFSDSLCNDRRGNGEYYIWQSLEIQNCAASMQNMLLMATSLGVGSCWISASDKMNFTRLFGGQSWRKLLANYEIPDYYHMQGIVMLGKPRETGDDGFPLGERKHGATLWSSTTRGPIEDYLIERRESELDSRKISLFDSVKVRYLSKLVRLFLKVANWADVSIHKIELKKYLRPGD
tara:strand:- start:56 stop:889 length:834 start_codon:yes stop_codon:yes gene_type:complete